MIELKLFRFQGSSFIKFRDNKFYGFLGDILNELSKAMNFSLSIPLVEDTFGSYNSESQTWNGVVEKVWHGEAEMGVSEFTMTTRRRGAVDFTLPLVLGTCRLYVKKDRKSVV